MFFNASNFNQDLSKWQLNDKAELHGLVFKGSKLEGREPLWYKDKAKISE